MYGGTDTSRGYKIETVKTSLLLCVMKLTREDGFGIPTDL